MATGETIIKDAWRIVGDISDVKRNPLADMLDYLNDALETLYSKRYDLLLKMDASFDTPVAITTENYDTQILIGVSGTITSGLANYIAYRIYELDEADEANAQLSMEHLAKFERAI